MRPKEVLANKLYPAPLGRVTRIGAKLVRRITGLHGPDLGIAVTDPLAFSTVMGPAAESTVTPSNEVLAYTSPPMSLTRIAALPAVTCAKLLTARTSTAPKLVSAVTEPPTVSPVIDEFWPCTTTSLPIRENLTALNEVRRSAAPLTS